MKTRLNHVRINVYDINRALKWYEEILGFQNDGGWPLDNPKYYDFVSEEGAKFAIMEVESEKSYGRLNFDVENVDELWEAVKSKVDIVEPLFDTPWGTRKFTIKDLDGNELGFGGKIIEN
jgi:predicted enzyme related to lactoylglutathione lyase